VDTFLGRALTDVATGLPNLPYFRIIQNWEERRARRRQTLVRVIRVAVSGGDSSRRALLWRLCQELRTSDLIASEGRDIFHILLTTPDAENAEAIAERVRHLGQALEETASGGEPLLVQTEIEPPPEYVAEKGPCDPCEEHELIKPPPGGPLGGPLGAPIGAPRDDSGLSDGSLAG
jgi:hypothetical protein